MLEKENEDEAYALKLKKSKDVDEAVKYLKSIFWQYANNKEKYNYTRNEFRDVVSENNISEHSGKSLFFPKLLWPLLFFFG